MALAGKLLNVPFQVLTPVELGIAGIQDLDQDIAALDASPELAPELQIPLVGREDEAVLLLELGQTPPGLRSRDVARFREPRHVPLTSSGPCLQVKKAWPSAAANSSALDAFGQENFGQTKRVSVSVSQTLIRARLLPRGSPRDWHDNLLGRSLPLSVLHGIKASFVDHFLSRRPCSSPDEKTNQVMCPPPRPTTTRAQTSVTRLFNTALRRDFNSYS